MRDYKEGVDSYHGLKTRIVTCDSSEDGPQLLVYLFEAPRSVPIDRKERVGSVTLSNVEVTSKAKGVAECSTRCTKGSDGWPVAADDGKSVMRETPKGAEG